MKTPGKLSGTRVGHKRKEISNRQQLQIGGIELLQEINVRSKNVENGGKGGFI